MAVKYKMDEDARDTLDRRVLSGREALKSGREALKTHDSYASEEAETAARDLVSNILTTLFGPAGYCVEGGSPSSPGEVVVGPYKVVLDEERGGLARTFLDLAYESWEGDAEDYTATLVTVDNPLLAEDEPVAPPPLNDGEWWHVREAVGDYLAGFVEAGNVLSSDYADALSVAEKLGLNVDSYPDPS